MLPTAFVALGANLGRREESILKAVRQLQARRAGRVVRVSGLYESDPEDIPGAPRFLNAVAEVAALLSPVDLLQRLKSIEAFAGRRGGHGESREIDLDLVTWGNEVLETPDLVLPHPRFHRRAFVLVPLREIAPDFRCPKTGRSIDELVDALPGAGSVIRVGGWSTVTRG
ncbi:MAG TPA: 2-amino-4-hydroxy-6-hydroxymethyldihydropteridine diphosphokinase [Candidatus Krumholzibacteria bacterium]|nr:2-amino-4-hydroxy-6-hydroxymethyldihydropteridine diphosphokinase [Candidatus Krumholzibacteria bacterium]